MKFVSYAKYGSTRAEIEKVLPNHIEYAEKLRMEGHLAIAGPLVDASGMKTGVVFIYEADTRDEALALSRDDPFSRAGLFSSVELAEWRMRGANANLLAELAQRSSGKHQKRLFFNYVHYTDNRARLGEVRPLHWDYARDLRKGAKLALAGPFADDHGAILVYAANSREEAIGYQKGDPFYKENIYAQSELFEWIVMGMNPGLLQMAKES